MDHLIQTLWIGARLSTMEQLSIRSFLNHGHEYHLYVYEEVEGVPPGTIIKDARDILPDNLIFQYGGSGSYAGFSNFFRYRLLLEKGGWWVDTDVVCVRPFIFDTSHVLATERDPRGREFVTSGIIRAPRGSELMQRAWEICQSKDRQQLRWGETGPVLMHHLAMRHSFMPFAQAPEVFCPIDPSNWIDAIMPHRIVDFEDHTYGIHLWNELWRRHGIDKDEIYAPACLYEVMKKQHL